MDKKLEKIVSDVINELKYASEKHLPMHSYHEGYAVIKEELDELWDGIKADADYSFIKLEAIQVAAMAIRFLYDLKTD